jgi:23S rRNA pseudouridine1911/1915/1917 synthase
MSKLEVLYEDNHLIAVCKKAGDIVQGDKTEDKPLVEFVKDYIKTKYNKPGDVFLGVIHRLDRPVGGVVIFARTSKALARMNEKFRDKDVQKTYWAIVENTPPAEEATLVHFMKKNEIKNKSRAYEHEVKDSKQAILEYKLMGRSKNYFYVVVKPQTGRHHQIRVQLSTIGCPIKGDVKYGGHRTNKDGSIHLFGKSLEFEHPVTKEPIVIHARPPKEDPLWGEMFHLLGN